MLTSDLIHLYRELYHVSADGSWPSIARQGLLTAAQVVERWDASARDRAILGERRSASIPLAHPDLGTAVIRDHGPINAAALADALGETTVEEWYRILNERVFFFLQRRRLDSLLGAYSKQINTLITVDTASLVAAHESRIELCRINSGFAQPHNKTPRSRSSFQPIAEYPHPDRKAPSPTARDVAELTVLGGVPDLAAHVVRVERVFQGEVLERLR